MRYLVIIGAFFSLGATMPALAQVEQRRPYEIKLKAYVDCVERQFRRNASDLGNKPESANKAQATCSGLYEETIAVAASTGEPIADVKAAMESSRKEAVPLMVQDMEELTKFPLVSAALSKIMMDNCPRINREKEGQYRELTLARLMQEDARFRDAAYFNAKVKEAEDGERAAFFKGDGTPKPELDRWCQVWGEP